MDWLGTPRLQQGAYVLFLDHLDQPRIASQATGFDLANPIHVPLKPRFQQARVRLYEPSCMGFEMVLGNCVSIGREFGLRRWSIDFPQGADLGSIPASLWKRHRETIRHVYDAAVICDALGADRAILTPLRHLDEHGQRKSFVVSKKAFLADLNCFTSSSSRRNCRFSSSKLAIRCNSFELDAS
ncbi:hypothetical protein ACSQ8I_08995 [Marinovum sp. E06]|uniref:hypothetical protein n=1 Tax=Marinovum sp. E06 TaxID=3449225 RepID=UPI003EDBE75C